MVSRRTVLKGAAALAAGAIGFAGYAFGIEPMWRLRVQRYRVAPSGWPTGLNLRATLIADLHAGPPQMSIERIAEIVARANALEPDIHLLLGDYAAGHRWVTKPVHSDEWAAVLGRLKAPLGTHAILGNHDWWDDVEAQRRGRGPIIGAKALEKNGIRTYENDAVRLTKAGRPFWLAGLGDQLALVERYRRRDLYPDEHPRPGTSFDTGVVASDMPLGSRAMFRQRKFRGIDDLPGTMAKITDDAPVVMMAHEPDAFTQMPARVALTVSGHTHGGQVRLLGYSPVVPSRHGNRYAYGHIVENDRHLVVSGGLGCSIMPVRFGVPPEIVVLEIGAGTVS